MTAPVSQARATAELRDASKASCAARANRAAVALSIPKACMVRTAPTASAAKAEASASRSCATRERRLTPRPEKTSGRTMKGIARITSPDSLGLVITIMASAPRNSMTLRSASDTLTPKADFTCVVSAVSRDTSSPDFAASKKAGSSTVNRPKTAALRSATMRSPSVTTV